MLTFTFNKNIKTRLAKLTATTKIRLNPAPISSAVLLIGKTTLSSSVKPPLAYPSNFS
jgi:hypothetical protein